MNSTSFFIVSLYMYFIYFSLNDLFWKEKKLRKTESETTVLVFFSLEKIFNKYVFSCLKAHSVRGSCHMVMQNIIFDTLDICLYVVSVS
jgi:hypothetical protein